MVTEEKFLESVYQSRMTLPEFSQFIERQLNELETLSGLPADAPMLQQLTALKTISNELENISFLDFDRLFGISHRVIFLKSSVFLRKKAFLKMFHSMLNR